MSQDGKVALVTGGAQGIGKAFAQSLLAEGASVAILDVNQTAGEATLKELIQKYPEKIIFLHCDVTNHNRLEECFKATLQKFSHLDIVINNAGIGTEKGDLWERMIDVNFTAVVKGSKLGMKYMGKANGGKGGTIVNIASVIALMPFPPLPVYAATKAAVNHFSRSFGQEIYYKKSGVKVISISPGLTETGLPGEKIPESLSDDKDLIENWKYLTGKVYLQKVSTLGRGLIEVLKNGENGSLWTIDNDEAPVPTVVQ